MKYFGLAGLVILAGCATTETQTTANVEITSAPFEVEGCERLGTVEGNHNLFGGAMVAIAIEAAENQMKNDAAAMGGNTILMTRSSSGWSGANMAGTAYRCP
ncbi:DUF4156 domain-containing protein [Pararhizobium haloflavum]|uniref:DUF4156 domain-containing protein n=1 Tax=Pararhizobium haloflavum TaxID=2037914 RepID=UPI0012FFDED0|nr:DUF4156 domain-containing protein [Pararhizobium haloflavum]